MAAPLEIRRVRPEDHAAWRALWVAYLAFYGVTLSDAVIAATWARLLSDDDREPRCLVALADGSPVGIAHVLRHRDCWRPEDVHYLQDLFVSPTVRGRGVGGALLRAIYTLADQAGAPRVTWLTAIDNAPARRLYDTMAKAMPFVPYARG